MAADNFQTSLGLTLRYEGSTFVDDPQDPGGPTLKGVTQRVYDDYRQKRGLPGQSVRLMAEHELRDIYKRLYWDACRCDDLPRGVDYAVFDYAVNSGVSRSAKTLQKLVGIEKPDGKIGPITLAAVDAYIRENDAATLTDFICTQRLAFLKGLPTFARFGKGWTRRVMGDMDGPQDRDTGVIDRAFAMTRQDNPHPPVDPEPTPKTHIDQ